MDMMLDAADSVFNDDAEWMEVDGLSQTNESDDIIIARRRNGDLIDICYWAYNTIKLVTLSNASVIRPLTDNDYSRIEENYGTDFEIAIRVVDTNGISSVAVIDTSDDISLLNSECEVTLDYITELDMQSEEFDELATDEFRSAIHM